MVPFSQMVYLADQDAYIPDNEVPAGGKKSTIFPDQLRRRLEEGREILPPGLPSRKRPASSAASPHPPGIARGLTVFFTGLRARESPRWPTCCG